jgi:hypothetical protein
MDRLPTVGAGSRPLIGLTADPLAGERGIDEGLAYLDSAG